MSHDYGLVRSGQLRTGQLKCSFRGCLGRSGHFRSVSSFLFSSDQFLFQCNKIKFGDFSCHFFRLSSFHFSQLLYCLVHFSQFISVRITSSPSCAIKSNSVTLVQLVSFNLSSFHFSQVQYTLVHFSRFDLHLSKDMSIKVQPVALLCLWKVEFPLNLPLLPGPLRPGVGVPAWGPSRLVE